MEFYQPLSVAGTFFVAPRVSFGTQRVAVYQQDNRIAEYNVGSRRGGGGPRRAVPAVRRVAPGPGERARQGRTRDRAGVAGPRRRHHAPWGRSGPACCWTGSTTCNFPRFGWNAGALSTTTTRTSARNCRTPSGLPAAGWPIPSARTRCVLGSTPAARSAATLAGLRPVPVGRLPAAVGLCHRPVDRAEPAVRPTHVLPPHCARQPLRWRLRRLVARNRQGRRPAGEGQPGRGAAVDRRSSSARTASSGRCTSATARPRTGRTASTSISASRCEPTAWRRQAMMLAPPST